MQSLSLVLALLLVADNELPSDFSLPAPPGPFVGSSNSGNTEGVRFKSGDPLIATTYFYWYDAESKAHLVDADGSDALTDHPVTVEGLSYRNPEWHAEQLEDMIAAGIDVAMPVYWGSPGSGHRWSDVGLPKLVAARKQLLARGKKPPAIGMFYHTSTLRHNGGGYHVDLRTVVGRRWFYGTIRNFFSLIPPQHRALIDGKPLVFLYGPDFAKGVDEELFPSVRKMFRDQFATDLFLVKMLPWPGRADSQYMWGGAIRPQFWETAGIGPGYDHSAVPGRQPLVRDRENGQFYSRAWETLLSQAPAGRSWLVHLETWNEFHEGTEVCETKEYGRMYLELTRRFADSFHTREQIRSRQGMSLPSVISVAPHKPQGIAIFPLESGDGRVSEKVVGGGKAWSTAASLQSPQNRYLYFAVDDKFLINEDEPIEVTVRYFDSGPEAFWFEYDSGDPRLSGLRQAFRSGHRQSLGESGMWKEVTFTIQYPRFAGRSNGADFRLGCSNADLVISNVALRRSRRR